MVPGRSRPGGGMVWLPRPLLCSFWGRVGGGFFLRKLECWGGVGLCGVANGEGVLWGVDFVFHVVGEPGCSGCWGRQRNEKYGWCIVGEHAGVWYKRGQRLTAIGFVGMRGVFRGVDLGARPLRFPGVLPRLEGRDPVAMNMWTHWQNMEWHWVALAYQCRVSARHAKLHRIIILQGDLCLKLATQIHYRRANRWVAVGPSQRESGQGIIIMTSFHGMDQWVSRRARLGTRGLAWVAYWGLWDDLALHRRVTWRYGTRGTGSGRVGVLGWGRLG
ncbi:hypothetical protein Tco_0495814 [Tanacetum coccineum]